MNGPVLDNKQASGLRIFILDSVAGNCICRSPVLLETHKQNWSRQVKSMKTKVTTLHKAVNNQPVDAAPFYSCYWLDPFHSSRCHTATTNQSPLPRSTTPPKADVGGNVLTPTSCVQRSDQAQSVLTTTDLLKFWDRSICLLRKKLQQLAGHYFYFGGGGLGWGWGLSALVIQVCTIHLCVCVWGGGGVGRVRAGNSVSVRVFVFRVRVCFILLCMTMYE